MDAKITEKDSHYQSLEKMSTHELLTNINREDQSVAHSVAACLPQIEALIDAIYPRMQAGGRLFYLGAGTSGRLGIVDASECPPTFGIDHGVVVGLIAGGDSAIRRAVEFAEDSEQQGWKDLEQLQVNELDSIIGITASGTTPYVLGAIKAAKEHGQVTGGITCNKNAPLAALADFPIECEVGPEFITGSTRMKAGTAQKLILNMISSSLMIKLGRVRGNKMVDMQLSNNKLVERGTKMVMSETGLNQLEAQAMLMEHGSVRKAVDAFLKQNENN